MADKNINILLTLQSKITGDLAKVTRTLDKTKESLQSLDKIAKQSRRIAGDIAFIGTAISGVFGLSLQTAATYNMEVASANQKLTNSFKAIQVEIAKGILPVYEKLANFTNNIAIIFKNMDPILKQKVLSFIAIGAAITVLTGIFGNMIARIITVIAGVGKLAISLTGLAIANPYIASIVALIILLSYVTYKFATDWNDAFETKVIPVLSKTESVFMQFIAGAQRDLMNLFKTLNFLLIPAEKVFELVGKIPGNKGYAELAKGISFAREQLDLLAQASNDAMNSSLGRANEIVAKNNGVLSKIFSLPVDQIKDYKKFIDDTILSLTKKNGNVGLSNSGFFQGYIQGLKNIQLEMSNFSQFGITMAQKTATAMSTYFSDSFFAVFTGDLSNLEEAFSNFAKSILRMISDVIAQYLTLAALSSVVGGPFTSVFSGLYGTMHTGGEVVRAHSGRAPAFDEVDLRLQTGEGVLSRKGMNNIGGKDNLKAINSGAAVSSNTQPIININLQTWDAQDIIRNRKTIEGVIVNAINSNSGLRRTIKNA